MPESSYAKKKAETRNESLGSEVEDSKVSML